MQIYLHIAVWQRSNCRLIAMRISFVEGSELWSRRLIIIFLVREEVFEKEFNDFLFASCLSSVIIKLLKIEDNFYNIF